MHTRIEQRHLDAELLPSYSPDGRTEAELVEPLVDALKAAIADTSVTAARVFAGRIFTRKNEQSVRPLGTPGTSRYESSNDDYYLQIGIRIPNYAAQPVHDAIAKVEALMDAQLLRDAQAKLSAAQERTAAAREEEDRVQAEVDRLTQKE